MLNSDTEITNDLLDRFELVVNTDQNPIQYLSIDPGTKNGICGYDEKFYLMFMYTIEAKDIIKVLARLKKVKKCIIETYSLYPNKAKEQVYSDMETPRVIGRVESWAEINQVQLIKQPSSIKPTGYKWIGEKPLSKSNKKNHELDAHVHFMYWAVKNGKVNAADLLRRRTTQI